MSRRRRRCHSSPFPSCFRPTSTNNRSTTVVPPPSRIYANPRLTTSLYHTELGLFALTWSTNLFGGRSLHIHLLPFHDFADNTVPSSAQSNSTPSFHLRINLFTFWKKRGSKILPLYNSNNYNNNFTSKMAQVYWDLSRAKYGSRPDPLSGFYVAIVMNGEMTLLVGDSFKEAYVRTRAKTPEKEINQVMILRREHVYGNKIYTTKAFFGGKERHVSIDYRLGDDDPKLYFSIDNKRVLQIKHLKWKFRGNERIEVDGIPIQVSWDVHNWLFEDDEADGYALFMFKFEKLGGRLFQGKGEGEDPAAADHDYCFTTSSCGLGFETKKMKKGLLRSGKSSSSSSSLSSASSSCSSVMEWASVEENELKGPSGFSLVVYAWKS